MEPDPLPRQSMFAPVEGAPGRHLFVASLGVVSLLFAVTLGSCTPSFMTNDDPAMSMIVSGTGFSPAPDEHMVPSSIWIGRLLKRLYRGWHTFPWYGTYQLLVHFVSQVALLFAVLRLACSARRLASYCLLFAVVGSSAVTGLQFTMTAFVAAQGGLALYLVALAERRRDSTARIGGLVGASLALLVLGALVRFKGLYLAAGLAAPAALTLAWGARQRQVVLPLVGVPCAGLLICWMLVAHERSQYEASSELSEYHQVAYQLGPYADLGRGAEGPQRELLLKATGWSPNDVDLLLAWFYVDPGVFSIARARRGQEALELEGERWNWSAVASSWARIRRTRELRPMALMLPLLLLGLRPGLLGRNSLVLVAGTFVVSLIAVLGMALFVKAVPARVYLPLLSAPLVMAVLFGGGAPGARGRARWPAREQLLGAVAIALAALGGLYSLSLQRARSSAAVVANRELVQSLSALEPLDRKLIVDWPPAFPYRAILPIESNSYLANLRLYALGWPQRSPLSGERLRAFGITDLVRALYERPDVYLASSGGRRNALLEAFVREHHGVEVRTEAERQLPSFALHRVRRVDARP